MSCRFLSIASGNGLAPNIGDKPLLELMLDDINYDTGTIETQPYHSKVHDQEVEVFWEGGSLCISSSYGLALNRRQAITRTNAELDYEPTNMTTLFRAILPCWIGVKPLPVQCWKGTLTFKEKFMQTHQFALITVDFRVDSKFVPSQWEMLLLCNNISLAGRKPRISLGFSFQLTYFGLLGSKSALHSWPRSV